MELKEELTENQKKELELYTRKENYKKTQKYLVSEDFEKLCKYFELEGKITFEEILDEIENREKAEAIKSEVDKIKLDIQYYKTIKEQLGESDGELVFKAELDQRILNAESNIYIKVAPDELFDLPVYTKLDFLKLQRNASLTVGKYLTMISEGFFDSKEKEDNPNPYEDTK